MTTQEITTESTVTMSFNVTDFSCHGDIGVRSGSILVAPTAMLPVGVVAIVVSLFFNLVLLFTVLYLHWRHMKPCYVIISSLAVSDVLVAVLYAPLLLVSTTGELNDREQCIDDISVGAVTTDASMSLSPTPTSSCPSLCAAVVAIEHALVAGCVWGATLVSVDRYLFIIKHATYRSKMTYRRAWLGVATVWAVAALMAVLSYLSAARTAAAAPPCCPGQHPRQGLASPLAFYRLAYSALYIGTSFILPTVLIVTFYGFIIRMAVHLLRKKKKNQFPSAAAGEGMWPGSESNGSGLRSRATESEEPVISSSSHPPVLTLPIPRVKFREVRAAKILCLLVLIYLVSYTPYFVLTTLQAIPTTMTTSSASKSSPNSLLGPEWARVAVCLLLVVHSATNPLFYGLANRRLRRALDAFLRQYCRPSTIHTAWLGRSFSSGLSVMGETSSVGVAHSSGSLRSNLSSLSQQAILRANALDDEHVPESSSSTISPCSNSRLGDDLRGSGFANGYPLHDFSTLSPVETPIQTHKDFSISRLRRAVTLDAIADAARRLGAAGNTPRPITPRSQGNRSEGNV